MAAKYDIIALIRDIFPNFWQNDTNNALTDVLIENTLGTVNNYYGDYETDTLEIVGYSIERKSLELSLNERFDPTLDRITVVQGDIVGSEFVYNEAENVSLLDLYVYNEGEAAGVGYQAYLYNEQEATGASASAFTVNVPIEYLTSESQIRAWIERVQIFGTEYELVFF